MLNYPLLKALRLFLLQNPEKFCYTMYNATLTPQGLQTQGCLLYWAIMLGSTKQYEWANPLLMKRTEITLAYLEGRRILGLANQEEETLFFINWSNLLSMQRLIQISERPKSRFKKLRSIPRGASSVHIAIAVLDYVIIRGTVTPFNPKTEARQRPNRYWNEFEMFHHE